MNKYLTGLRNWTDYINQMELPSLSNVIKELNRIADDKEAGVSDLSNVILKDEALTTKVIRIANAVEFNPQGHSINTVSKAIINIGFERVKSTSVSISVLDGFLKKDSKLPLVKLIAQSFHAATQARNLAIESSTSEKEEIFVATLLMHLGELSFYVSNLPQVREYFERVAKEPGNEIEICRDINGVSFQAITKSLAKDWGLGKLLNEIVTNPDKTDTRHRSVFMGQRISRDISKGWQSKEMKDILTDLESLTGLNKKACQELVVKGAKEAVSFSRAYGVPKLTEQLPSSQLLNDSKQDSSDNKDKNEPGADPQVQLKFIQKLTEHALSNSDINEVLATTVSALHEGAGLQRVVIALYNPSHSHVVARYVAGPNTGSWRQAFNMPISSDIEARDLFTVTVTSRQFQRLNGSEDKSRRLRTQELNNLLPSGDCFCAPFWAGQKVIGVIYADGNGESLDNNKYLNFQMFCNQLGLVMSQISH